MARKKPPTHRQQLLSWLGKGYPPSFEALIDEYCDVRAILDRMKTEIADSPLMMEYTNKAGATNEIKNPLIAEVPRYVATLEKLLKTMGLTAAGKKSEPPEAPDDGFNDF